MVYINCENIVNCIVCYSVYYLFEKVLDIFILIFFEWKVGKLYRFCMGFYRMKL